MIEQNFLYTCTGAEGSDFFIPLPATRIDDLYFVVCQAAGVANVFGIDLPNSAGSDRTTTQFRVVTTAAVQAGDRLEFHVYDPSESRERMIAATSGVASPSTSGNVSYSGGDWTWTGAATVQIPIDLAAGEQITSLVVYFARNSGTTISLSLFALAVPSAVASGLCSKDVSSGTGNLSQEIGSSPTSGSLPQTTDNSHTYFLSVFAGSTDKLRGVKVTTKRVA